MRFHEHETPELEIREVEGRLQQEYELKLQQSIQELRAEYEAQKRANKEALDSFYEQKHSDLKAQLKRLQSSSVSKREELVTLSARCDTQTRQISSIETQRNILLSKIKDLEKKMDLDQARFVDLLSDRDNEIDRLVLEKSTLHSEYQDLMDSKVAFDNEIATYRKLFEGVEKTQLSSTLLPGRTRVGSHSSDPSSYSVSTGAGLGGTRIGTLFPVTIRKRGAEAGMFQQETSASLAEYGTNSLANGDIEISNDDPEGKFITLHNKSDKKVSISGWQLIRISGDIDTIHTFNRQAKIDARATLTVWSSDATGAVHELPTAVIMKGQKWYTSDHCKTVLVNGRGDEQAVRETRRLQIIRQ